MKHFSVLLYPLLFVLSILPHWLFYWFSNILYLIAYGIVGYRKKIVRKNLNLALPHVNAKHKKEIEKKFYKHFCDILIEIIRPLARPSSWASTRIRFKNSNLIKQLQVDNRIIIVLASHYSNWELTPTISQFSSWSTYALYTPISNKTINRLIKKIRTKVGCQLVSRYKFANHITRQKKNNNGGLYIVANDQSPSSNAKTLYSKFLNQVVPVHNGAERIARILDIPVIYMSIKTTKRGFYEAEFELISQSPKEEPTNHITLKYLDLLQKQIAQDPIQYLWTHNRFKYSKNLPNS